MHEETQIKTPEYKRILTAKEAFQEIAQMIATDEFWEKAQKVISKGRQFEYIINVKPTPKGCTMSLKCCEKASPKEIRRMTTLSID